MKLRFAPAADLTDTSADQSFTLDVVAPRNTTDFHTSKDEGHLHHAELANLAAMARSIFHQDRSPGTDWHWDRAWHCWTATPIDTETAGRARRPNLPIQGATAAQIATRNRRELPEIR